MKTLGSLFAVLLLLALASCGSSGGTTTTDTTGGTDTVQGELPGTDTIEEVAAPKDTVSQDTPQDTEPLECENCSPLQTCVDGVCTDPVSTGDCPYGGVMIGTECGDVNAAGCCSDTDLYYCETNDDKHTGCPEGQATCMCKLNCSEVENEGTKLPFCSYYAAYEFFVCAEALIFPPEDSEVPMWCSWYTCTPDCEGKTCGADGCGGSCGECPEGDICNDEFACELCVPNCTDKACGDDGCGTPCGECAEGTLCDEQNGKCLAASCTGLCGGQDGAEAGCYCDATCETYGDCCPDICDACPDLGLASCCEPSCEGKTCGPDGCGGFCGPDGECPDDKICNTDQTACEAAPACDPTTCDAPWKVCKHGACANPVVADTFCPYGGYLLDTACGETDTAVGCCGDSDLYYCETNDDKHNGCPEGMDSCMCWIACGNAKPDPRTCGWDAANEFMNCLDELVQPPEGTPLSCDWFTPAT